MDISEKDWGLLQEAKRVMKEYGKSINQKELTELSKKYPSEKIVIAPDGSYWQNGMYMCVSGGMISAYDGYGEKIACFNSCASKPVGEKVSYKECCEIGCGAVAETLDSYTKSTMSKAVETEALKELRTTNLSGVPTIVDEGELGFSIWMDGKRLCWFNSKGERLLREHLNEKLEKMLDKDRK